LSLESQLLVLFKLISVNYNELSLDINSQSY